MIATFIAALHQGRLEGVATVAFPFRGCTLQRTDSMR